MSINVNRQSKISNAVSAALPVFALAAMLSTGPAASAAVLTYDADTTAPANDGPGVWDTTTANWFDGTNDVVWPNTTGDTAIFGAATAGTGGTVTVGTVNVGTIQFNPQTTTAYTLATGTITLGGAAAITTTNTLNSTISAVVTGTSGLNFTGVSGASAVGVTLSGANNYTGVTTLSTGGRISAANATALGSSTGATASALGTNYTQINAGTTVNVGNSTSEAFLINGQGSTASGNPPSALRIANGVALASFVQLGSNALIGSNFGTVTLNGNLDVQGFTASFGNGNNPGTFALNGVVTGTAGGIAINSGSGSPNIVNLNNAGNTLAGVITVNGGGTLGVGADTALGSSTLGLVGGTIQSTNATARTIANAISSTGSTIFGAIATQTGALNFTNTTAASLGTTAKTFTTNVNTTFANGFSNSAPLTKAGAAGLFLNGTSTATGLVTVSAGTLGGTGSLVAPITVASAATLAPATVGTAGVLTDSGAVAVTLSSGSNFNVDVQGLTAGTGYDQLSLTGATGDINLTGANLVATFSGFTPTAAGGDVLYIINDVNAVRTVTGTFAGLADNATVTTFGGQTFLITYDANSATGSLDGGNDVALYTVAAPEPAALAVFSVLGGLGLIRRRKAC